MMKSTMTKWTLALSLTASAGMIGCGTAPQTETAKETLSDRAETALRVMKREDAGLTQTLNNAYGYVIFPSAGKGGFIVGGAFGRGEVYEQGKFVGYAKLQQGTIGAQVGGQSFEELIIFQDESSLRKFQRGEWAPAANATAVILKSGVAATAQFKEGVMTIIRPTGGAMAEAAIGGQKFTFQAATKRDAE
jgi:lipid-binding SYLF domain-containing protein